MSIKIYTYSDPYNFVEEKFWNEICRFPQFCVSQTMVNGLRSSHPNGEFDGGRVTTFKILLETLYKEWLDVGTRIKQYSDVENVLNGMIEDEIPCERENIINSFRYNREDVLNSIRMIFEMDLDLNRIDESKVSKEQGLVLEVYDKIINSSCKSDFEINKIENEQFIDDVLKKAVTKLDGSIDLSKVDMSGIIIHGVHQFSPIMLRAIDEIAKYKDVIMLINYKEEYSNIYQTWVNVYENLPAEELISGQISHTFGKLSSECNGSQKTGEYIGKLAEGRKDEILHIDNAKIIVFDNMMEFANYAADIFEEAQNISLKNTQSKLKSGKPINPIKLMKEQIYSADISVNNILKVYFPEQFGEREFLNYPIGRFFVAIANMWNAKKNKVEITDLNYIREALSVGIIWESYQGELVSIFNSVEYLFRDCTTIDEMLKRLRRVMKAKSQNNPADPNNITYRISYYVSSDENLSRLSEGLEELNELAGYFFDDFENRPNNFRQFYTSLKNYLKYEVKDKTVISKEFNGILMRIIRRLDEVKDIEASTSFACLKDTMEVYLKQEPGTGNGANWIVRTFEQLDGDILRSRNEKKQYHFACLSDDDMLSPDSSGLPWPVDEKFFKCFDQSEGWKIRTYLTSVKESSQFKKYALLYGLIFNCSDFKLSYVKHNNNKECDLYYLLKLLGVEEIEYKSYKKNIVREETESRRYEIQSKNKAYCLEDYMIYRFCQHKFMLTLLLDHRVVYRDDFLLKKYLERFIANTVLIDLQGMIINEKVITDKVRKELRNNRRYFPYMTINEELDVIKNTCKIVQNKKNIKNKRFKKIDEYDRKELHLNEIFLYGGKIRDLNNTDLKIVFCKTSEKSVQDKMQGIKLESGYLRKNYSEACEFCSEKGICLRKYCR